MEDGYVIIGTKLDKKGYKKGLRDLDDDTDSIFEMILNNIQSKIDKLGADISKIMEKGKKGLKNISSTMIQFGKLALKTMGQMVIGAIKFGIAFTTALGVIGLIATAVAILVKAIEKVSEEHKELKVNIQYILFAITTALQPAIDWVANVLVKIIQFLIKILQYAMAIANVIAGRNLFENASVEAFAKKMKEGEKSSKKTAKNAKEIKKQLAGFDEMTILQDTSSNGSIGGVGATLPTFDATNLGDIQSAVDELTEKIKKAFDITDGRIGETNIKLTDLINIPFTLGKKVGTWVREHIFNPVDEKLREWGFKETDLFNIPMALGRVLGTWVRQHIFDPIDKRLEKIGFKEEDMFNIPMALGRVAFNWLKGKIDELSTKLNIPEIKLTEIFNLPFTLGKKAYDYINGKIQKIKSDIDWLRDRIKANFDDGFLKGLVNTIIDVINIAIGKINSKLKITIGSDIVETLNGLGIKAKAGTFTIGKIPTIPRLAKGGIINMPNQGVAIGGEKGREGVIPLTDAQQMQLLGEAIGRYITINATILNKMNGRTLSREMTTVRGDNSFANNW